MSTVFTIGHSNQSAAEFVALLVEHNIERVVDVRSKPYFRFRHFNREALTKRLGDLGIDYVHLGDHLGGHPESDEFYVNGRVVYERIATTRGFRRDINRVAGERANSIAWFSCVRRRTRRSAIAIRSLALAMLERGLQVLHLRRDGSAQDARTMADQINPQMSLVEPPGEDFTWRSPKRIRRRNST